MVGVKKMLGKIKYKGLAITLLILIGFFLIIGGSYALWVVRLSQLLPPIVLM